VALPAGALVVNSSQGGGSKDTWVLAEDAAPPATTLPRATHTADVIPHQVGRREAGPTAAVMAGQQQ
jgi:hypothetical protein